MKYAFNFLLIFLFCFTIASCGGGDEAVQPIATDPIDTDTGGDTTAVDTTAVDTTVVDPVEPVDPNPQDGAINPIPESFTHKIVIEEATGNWCGWCPTGTTMMDKYTEEYPNRVYGVAVHGGSPTEPMLNKAMLDNLARTYDLRGYPGGLINRLPSVTSGDLFMHPFEWSVNINKQLEKTTNSVGIALETNINEADALASVQVHVGFGKDVNTSVDYKILLYLLEDGIVAPQANYLSGDLDYKDTEYHKFFEAPRLIEDFVHNHVARRAFTSLNGEEIPTTDIGEFKKFKQKYQINLTREDNLAKSYVVAVVLRGGSKPSVVNVQKVKLGETKNWD